MRENSEKILTRGRSLDDDMVLTLTLKDMLLLMLCLQLVDRNYTRGGALRSDIQGLRDKLSRESARESR